jgi:hypothetical protein
VKELLAFIKVEPAVVPVRFPLIVKPAARSELFVKSISPRIFIFTKDGETVVVAGAEIV